ncbi:MAG: hypothetical protein IAE98_03190 [Candidatus Kapabacteria bacterium]|nr:hypothetical protein [Candidatus Kapabacteria bacterium]
MATLYRLLDIGFWDDPDLEDYSLEEKAFYLMLFSNRKTTDNLCGIYELSYKDMMHYTNLSRERVVALVQLWQDIGKIIYDPKHKEMCVKNFVRRNYHGSPSQLTSIINGLMKVKNREYIDMISLEGVTDPLIINLFKGNPISIKIGKQQFPKTYRLNSDSSLHVESIKSDDEPALPFESESEEESDTPEQTEEPETPETTTLAQSEKLEMFERFWELYDKKADKQSCQKLFTKLSQKTIEKIMAHIPIYVKNTPDKKFRKNPKTYLRNQSWNDEIIIGSTNGTSNKGKRTLKLSDLEASREQSGFN